MHKLDLVLQCDVLKINVRIQARIYADRYSAQRFTDSLYGSLAQEYRNVRAVCLMWESDDPMYKHDCYLLFNHKDISVGQIAHECSHLLLHMYKVGGDIRNDKVVLEFAGYEQEEVYCADLEGMMNLIYDWWCKSNQESLV